VSTGCSLPSHPQAQEKQVARNCYVTIQHCNIKRQGQTSSSSANRHYNVPKIGSSPSILVITCYTHDIIRPKTRNSNTHLPSSSCILPLHQQKIINLQFTHIIPIPPTTPHPSPNSNGCLRLKARQLQQLPQKTPLPHHPKPQSRYLYHPASSPSSLSPSLTPLTDPQQTTPSSSLSKYSSTP